MLTLAVPNFNGARYIEATLESLAANRPYVRWWLQDGCSRDESVAIARRYQSEHDNIVVEKDNGQTHALNQAISCMGGEIIGYLNSDDCLAPGAAKAVLDAFANNPDVDMVYGDVEWIDFEGNVTGLHSGCISTAAEVLNVYEVWWCRRQFVQPEVFFRRRLWDKVGLFNTAYDLAFDYEYWVRCFLAGARVLKLPRVLCQFRKHPDQKSVRALDAANQIRDIVRDNLPRCETMPPLARAILSGRLTYDRYQVGQDYPNSTDRPSLPRFLLSHPQAVLSPELRQRLFSRW